jgi:hypothetical protein
MNPVIRFDIPVIRPIYEPTKRGLMAALTEEAIVVVMDDIVNS